MATRWGIVGAGKISHDFVTALRSLPEAEHKVVAVAARQIENSKAFATLHDIPVAYGSYLEIAKNHDVEVAYIGNINTNHFSLGRLMLEHGKHVLIEKPLCLNIKECEELVEIAKRKQLFLMEAIWSRFLPAYEYLMKEIETGTAGNILNVTCTLGFPLLDVESIIRKDLGGGGLMNIGIYCVNAIAMVYAHEWPEKISAVGHLNQEGVDDNLSVCLQYSHGRLATFTTSCVATLSCELHISGTKGTFKLPSMMCCPTEVFFENQRKEFPLPPPVVPCNYSNSVGLRYQAMEVRRCLLDGLLESPRMSHAHSKHIHEIMHEICSQLNITYPESQR